MDVHTSKGSRRFTNLCLNAHEHFKLGLGLGVRELLNEVIVKERLTRNY
jgi:hypothetical protein